MTDPATPLTDEELDELAAWARAYDPTNVETVPSPEIITAMIAEVRRSRAARQVPGREELARIIDPEMWDWYDTVSDLTRSVGGDNKELHNNAMLSYWGVIKFLQAHL